MKLLGYTTCVKHGDLRNITTITIRINVKTIIFDLSCYPDNLLAGKIADYFVPHIIQELESIIQAWNQHNAVELK